MNNVYISPEDLPAIEARYMQAVENGEKSFRMDIGEHKDLELLTDYAKYLIEYLSQYYEPQH